MDFREAKLQQLDAATTYRVYGHEVDFDQSGAGSGGTARRRWRPISPCFCVQDSPDSPCDCMHGQDVWWLLDDAVIGEGKSGHKDKEGNDLQFFDLLVDSQIVVESPQPVSVGALKNLGDTISPQRVRDLVSNPGAGAAPQFSEAEGPFGSGLPFLWDFAMYLLKAMISEAVDAVIKPIEWPPKPG
jgi:hypothetical protein